MGKKRPLSEAHKKAIAEGVKRAASRRKADARLGRAVLAYLCASTEKNREEYHDALAAALRMDKEAG